MKLRDIVTQEGRKIRCNGRLVKQIIGMNRAVIGYAIANKRHRYVFFLGNISKPLLPRDDNKPYYGTNLYWVDSLTGKPQIYDNLKQLTQ